MEEEGDEAEADHLGDEQLPIDAELRRGIADQAATFGGSRCKQSVHFHDLGYSGGRNGGAEPVRIPHQGWT